MIEVNGLDDDKVLQVMPLVRREFGDAKIKHPIFCGSLYQAVAIITEELGELAKAINDGDNKQALIEAAHVTVTALRTMIEIEERLK